MAAKAKVPIQYVVCTEFAILLWIFQGILFGLFFFAYVHTEKAAFHLASAYKKSISAHFK